MIRIAGSTVGADGQEAVRAGPAGGPPGAHLVLDGLEVAGADRRR